MTLENATGALAIFVKLPGHALLELPLASALEAVHAEKFQSLAIELIGSAALEAKEELGLHPYWVVASDEEAAHPLLKGFETLVIENNGSEGERFFRVYEKIREKHGFALLIKSETPQIGLLHLKKAADVAKATGEFVVGPTESGAIYLVAGSQFVPPEVWGAIPFGTSVAEKAISRLFSHFGGVNTILKIYDLQNLEDLQNMEFDFASQMHQFGKDSLTRQQRSAFEWIKEIKAQHAFRF